MLAVSLIMLSCSGGNAGVVAAIVSLFGIVAALDVRRGPMTCGSSGNVRLMVGLVADKDLGGAMVADKAKGSSSEGPKARGIWRL